MAPIIGGAAGAGIIVIIALIVVVVVIVVRRRSRQAQQVYSTSSVVMEEEGPYKALPQWKVITDVIVQDPIGSGCFGQVYKGTWNNTTVALKTLKQEEDSKGFFNEISILQNLTHPNIVQYFGIFTENSTKRHFMVMEYLSKGSLKDFIQNTQSISNADLLLM